MLAEIRTPNSPLSFTYRSPQATKCVEPEQSNTWFKTTVESSCSQLQSSFPTEETTRVISKMGLLIKPGPAPIPPLTPPTIPTKFKARIQSTLKSTSGIIQCLPTPQNMKMLCVATVGHVKKANDPMPVTCIQCIYMLDCLKILIIIIIII